ncbi:FAD-dependent oxidoreductase [Erysipelothrix sp. HDW6A]|uniref:NAD(P)/FAD-dependent oxidoreductase n=1 Tax=Erysipelothrix sp. HDW6A TaxID=2714928 RepID=UPI00140CFF29|nr:FAD-dependent oxidoreductase [Erysipelothrix sp. HDW6A]QIK56899.1 FAD-dependent oxidoreductase [Erysipelothrix sp. HDW6A]
MTKNYDVIIIGGGPAGLSAAIYAGRAGLNTMVLEYQAPGGKMVKTDEIANYPGINEINGVDLSMKMFEHATESGVEYQYGEVSSIKDEGEYKRVITAGEEYLSKVVIVASGTNEKTLGFKEDDELLGKGISYCAVCDGSFYRNKDVVVIGGGNSALEEAVYLTQFVNKVDLVIRRDVFRGDVIAQKQVLSNPKINIIREHTPSSYIINDDGSFGGVKFQHSPTGEDLEVNSDGLFPYIGAIPATGFLKDLDGVLDDEGYIIVDEDLETAIPGIFGAGDVIQKKLRQVVTATNDGAITAQNAFQYIQEQAFK